MDNLHLLSEALPAQETSASINSLPPEMLIRILEFVDALEDKRKTICNACLVSQYWCNLAQPVLYRRVFFYQGVPYLNPFGGGIQSEFDSKEDDQGDCDWMPPLMRTLSQRPDLKEMIQSVVHRRDDTWHFVNLNKMFPQLRTLYTSRVRDYDLQALTSLPYLETLSMDDTTIGHRGNDPNLRFPSLRDLTLSEDVYDTYLPIHVLPHIPVGQLQALQVRRYREWNRDDGPDGTVTRVPEALRPHMPTLKKFEFSIFDRDENSPELSHVINLLPLATRLTKLSIRVSSLDNHLPNLLQKLPQSIEDLGIEFNPDFDPSNHIYRISQTCTFAEALLDRLLQEALPHLNRLALTSMNIQLLEWKYPVPQEEIARCRWGLIEHFPPLMEELRTRNISYTSNRDVIGRTEIDDIQYL